MSITLNIPLQVNNHSIFSLQEFKDVFLSGIPIPDTMSDTQIQFFIDAAISELEDFLNLKFKKQVITEEKDFQGQDWQMWGYIKCTYPVVCIQSLQGFLGTTLQVNYPKNWLSSRKTSDNHNYSRAIYIVPISGDGTATYSGSLIYSGLIPQTGVFSSRQIPDYWTMKYVTGWDKVPKDILNCIGMMASVSILQIISDGLLLGTLKSTLDQNGQIVKLQSSGVGGLGIGVSSKSISIDGLSQSTSSWVNGNTGIFGARLKQYIDELSPKTPGSLLNRLYDTYATLVMGVA